jgi:S-adenosylmethionine synthetase
MTMLYAAEYVLPGHPDKLCDAIADALVEEAARREKRALCGIEVAAHRASVFITGRIACRGAKGIPVKRIARECYRAAGYGTGWQPAPEDLDVRTNLCLGPLLEGEAVFREVSDDQSIVTGYAVDSPGTNWLPAEHWLAWRLAGCVERLRVKAPDLGLGPDGKVVLVYDSEANALASFSASLQQKIGAGEIDLHREVRSAVGLRVDRVRSRHSWLQARGSGAFPRERCRQLRSGWAGRGQRAQRQETGRRRIRPARSHRGRGAQRKGLLQG